MAFRFPDPVHSRFNSFPARVTSLSLRGLFAMAHARVQPSSALRASRKVGKGLPRPVAYLSVDHVPTLVGKKHHGGVLVPRLGPVTLHSNAPCTYVAPAGGGQCSTLKLHHVLDHVLVG